MPPLFNCGEMSHHHLVLEAMNTSIHEVSHVQIYHIDMIDKQIYSFKRYGPLFNKI